MNPQEFFDQTIYREIKTRWDRIAKPIEGMGTFEELISRIGAVQHTRNVDLSKRCVVVMCADNGIVEEGVSQSGQDVTYSVASWMGKKESSVCRLALPAGAEVIPVDIGINASVTPEGVLDYKIERGTKNFLKEPAMTEEQCHKAIETGIEIAAKCRDEGYKIIASGEMGIGNTTTSAALLEIFCGDEEVRYAGRGAGLSDQKLERKKWVISEAVRKYGGKDAFEVLRSIGGFDIAGLAGLFIGGARYHVPVVIDGAISAAAAVCAEKLEPGCKQCMIPSHIGKEPATAAALEFLGLKDLVTIRAGLALGEGTGAVMLFPLLDMALAMYRNALLFEETAVEQYERLK